MIRSVVHTRTGRTQTVIHTDAAKNYYGIEAAGY